MSDDPNDDDSDAEEKALAAAGCVVAMRRIIEAINKDKAGLIAILPIIYPIMMHSLTPDGLDAIEEGLDCINIMVYYAFDRNTRIPAELWKLLPQMMYIVVGNENDVDGGFAFDFLGQVAVCLQNFISRDPETLMTVGEGQTETYFQLAIKFIQQVLVINSKGVHKQDGVTILRVVIAIFENMPGHIDSALPHVVGMLLAEHKIAFEHSSPKNYKSMIYQALSMALYNNSVATLQIIESEGQTFAVFSNWLHFMSKFKLEFEIRRIIFGLLSILKTPGSSIPPIVQQQLPQITKQLAALANQCHSERMKTLEENEKYIKKGFEESEEEDEDSDEDEGEMQEFNKMKK